jgi:hypothetical protein
VETPDALPPSIAPPAPAGVAARDGVAEQSTPAYLTSPPPSGSSRYPHAGYPHAGYPDRTDVGYPITNGYPYSTGSNGRPESAGAWPSSYPPNVISGERPGPRGRTVPILVIAIVVALVATVSVAVSRLGAPASTATGRFGAVSAPPKVSADPHTLDSVLTTQSAALIAGDEAAFLAGVDPASKIVRSAYKRMYANLRALHVVTWSQSAPGGRTPISGVKHFDVDVSYCFVVTTCKGMNAQLSVTAAVKNGRTLIESYVPPVPSERFDEPIPWQTSPLTAVTGPRVVIAASSAEKSELAAALPIAERAAAAADKFAMWGKPAVYLIYLAGPSDAKSWFGGGLEHSTGEAIGLSATDIEVMVVLPAAGESRYAGPGRLGTVIQHEMGHVVTLYDDDQDTGHDSFIEGIAEFIAYNGHSSWAAYRLDNTREYLLSGKWSGNCYLTKEISSDDVLTGSAAYGIGYLTFKRLASKYGTTKMLDFWGGVERDGLTADQSARKTFGVAWKTVNADCASYIRRTLHA